MNDDIIQQHVDHTAMTDYWTSMKNLKAVIEKHFGRPLQTNYHFSADRGEGTFRVPAEGKLFLNPAKDKFAVACNGSYGGFRLSEEASTVLDQLCQANPEMLKESKMTEFGIEVVHQPHHDDSCSKQILRVGDVSSDQKCWHQLSRDIEDKEWKLDPGELTAYSDYRVVYWVELPRTNWYLIYALKALEEKKIPSKDLCIYWIDLKDRDYTYIHEYDGSEGVYVHHPPPAVRFLQNTTDRELASMSHSKLLQFVMNLKIPTNLNYPSKDGSPPIFTNLL